MKTLLLSDWHLIRVVRLVFGTMAVTAGFTKGDVLAGAVGGLLLYQAIWNVGCCGNSCAVPQKSTGENQTK
jgi:hypothetical protein